MTTPSKSQSAICRRTTPIANLAAHHMTRGLAPWMAALALASAPAPAAELVESRATDSIPGITYTNERRRDVPWSIHVIKVDRSRTDLEVHSTLARETVLGLATLVQQIKSLPNSLGRAVAALNGDFYEVEQGSPYIGDPRGLQILRGELVSAPTDQATFWLDARGTPWMTNVISRLQVTWPDGKSHPLGLNEERPSRGVVLYTPRLGGSTRTTGGRELVLERADDGPWLPLTIGTTVRGRVREIRQAGNTPLRRDVMILSLGSGLTNSVHVQTGATVTLSLETVPSLAGARVALSGGWVLVREGRVQELEIPDSGSYKYRNVVERHPRSAIGSDRNHLYLVQVDGRQKGLSVGMTLAELAEYMQGIGCEQALSLDGGASATIWFDGRVVNSPSSGFDREIANGLVVLWKAAPAP